MIKHSKLGVQEKFFQELRKGSVVKQQIVTEYFVAYNRVMDRGSLPKVGYADLFAGPVVSAFLCKRHSRSNN